MKQRQLGWEAWVVASLVAALATRAQAAPTVVKVAGGGYDTLFIESDGSLWGMGPNLSDSWVRVLT
jgi:alpha-tubulin suppressor-like RCC1 family protein